MQSTLIALLITPLISTNNDISFNIKRIIKDAGNKIENIENTITQPKNTIEPTNSNKIENNKKPTVTSSPNKNNSSGNCKQTVIADGSYYTENCSPTEQAFRDSYFNFESTKNLKGALTTQEVKDLKSNHASGGTCVRNFDYNQDDKSNYGFRYPQNCLRDKGSSWNYLIELEKKQIALQHSETFDKCKIYNNNPGGPKLTFKEPGFNDQYCAFLLQALVPTIQINIPVDKWEKVGEYPFTDFPKDVNQACVVKNMYTNNGRYEDVYGPCPKKGFEKFCIKNKYSNYDKLQLAANKDAKKKFKGDEKKFEKDFYAYIKTWQKNCEFAYKGYYDPSTKEKDRIKYLFEIGYAEGPDNSKERLNKPMRYNSESSGQGAY